MNTASKDQTIEALRSTAEALLRHIHQQRSASDALRRDDAEQYLYADAVTLRQQSQTLERLLAAQAHGDVYLGG